MIRPEVIKKGPPVNKVTGVRDADFLNIFLFFLLITKNAMKQGIASGILFPPCKPDCRVVLTTVSKGRGLNYLGIGKNRNNCNKNRI